MCCGFYSIPKKRSKKQKLPPWFVSLDAAATLSHAIGEQMLCGGGGEEEERGELLQGDTADCTSSTASGPCFFFSTSLQLCPCSKHFCPPLFFIFSAGQAQNNLTILVSWRSCLEGMNCLPGYSTWAVSLSRIHISTGIRHKLSLGINEITAPRLKSFHCGATQKQYQVNVTWPNNFGFLLFVGVIYSFHLEGARPSELIIGNSGAMMHFGKNRIAGALSGKQHTAASYWFILLVSCSSDHLLTGYITNRVWIFRKKLKTR